MELTQLQYAVSERVAVLTINRPERMNAWTPTLEQELRHAIELANSDDNVRCAVLTGAGRAFCAGMDMQILQAGNSSSVRDETSEEDTDQRYGYLWSFQKPLIAAINGAAAGVGLCLTLYCDLRFAAAGAKLTFPYARRGLVAEHGTAWLLPQLIGPMRSADLLLTGRTFLAEEAHSMGLADVLPAEGFMDAILDRARDMANNTSPRSTRIMKQQLLQARYQSLGVATRLADKEVAACRGTDDFREGVQHFLEKRAPAFTGN